MAIMNNPPRTADRERTWPARTGLSHLPAICLLSAEKETDREAGKRAAEIKLFNCAIKCTFVTFCATSVPCAGVDPQTLAQAQAGQEQSLRTPESESKSGPEIQLLR